MQNFDERFAIGKQMNINLMLISHRQTKQPLNVLALRRF